MAVAILVFRGTSPRLLVERLLRVLVELEEVAPQLSVAVHPVREFLTAHQQSRENCLQH